MWVRKMFTFASLFVYVYTHENKNEIEIITRKQNNGILVWLPLIKLWHFVMDK